MCLFYENKKSDYAGSIWIRDPDSQPCSKSLTSPCRLHPVCSATSLKDHHPFRSFSKWLLRTHLLTFQYLSAHLPILVICTYLPAPENLLEHCITSLPATAVGSFQCRYFNPFVYTVKRRKVANAAEY